MIWGVVISLILVGVLTLMLFPIYISLKRKYTISGNFYDNVGRILHEAAFSSITLGMDSSEIYTKRGTVRARIEKKIASKEEEYNNLYNKYSTGFKEYLRSLGYINIEDRVLEHDVSSFVNAFFNYIDREQSRYMSDITMKTISEGISPEEFFDLRSRTKGDRVGVYVIYNMSKDMYYVGQATRLFFRVNQHFTGHGNGDVYADYKYGDRFTILLLLLTESGYSDLDLFEKDMIEKYNSYASGYNRTSGNGESYNNCQRI